MTVRRLRVVRFRDMLWTDCTRPTEFFTGCSALLSGAWMLWLYYPPSPLTALSLWHYFGPTVQGTLLLTVGAVQVFAAGTKWVRLRWWAVALAAASWWFVGWAYLLTAVHSPATPLFAILFVRCAWVTIRIAHDRQVNGADQRMQRQYHGPSRMSELSAAEPAPCHSGGRDGLSA